MKKLILKSLVTIILSLFLTFSLFAEARNALLIANGSYKNLNSLTAPVNEARNLKKTLEKLGFSVTLVENGSREKMLDSLDEFQAKLKTAGGIGFFHYGGHGVQVNGKNYLIPVDANIPDEKKVSTRAVDVDEVMTSMQADTNIVILDACRDNPLPADTRSGASTRGLAFVAEKPKNSIIVYSAEPNKVAKDGVFTPILTEKLLEQKSFTDILMEVRREVQIRTNMAQSPEETGRLIENIYLAGYSAPTAVATANVAQTQTSTPKVNDGFVFVQGGTFSMGSNNGYSDQKPVHNVTVSDFYICDHEVTQAEYKAIMGTNPSYFKGDNLPVECVSWNDAVEYCNELSRKKGLTPCYKFNNGNVTCDWSANGYRLPTEAEWEYAAKGGKNGSGYTYSGSNSIGLVAWYGYEGDWEAKTEGNSNRQTHNVKTKKANELGLYDMSGNVFEWCWDWYGSYSSGAVTNPIGASSGSYRVERGGSWYYDASYCAVSPFGTATRRALRASASVSVLSVMQ